MEYVDKSNWEEKVMMPDEGTPILGGAPQWAEGGNMLSGYANVAAAVLADRTRWLRDELEKKPDINIPEGETIGQVLKWDGFEWYPARDNDTTYSPATADQDGLMSFADKRKLNSIVPTPEEQVVSVAGRTGEVVLVVEDISDASVIGKQVMTATTALAARNAIGAGTSSLTLGTSSTTAKAGDYTPPQADVNSTLAGTATNVYQTPSTYASVIAFADRGNVNGAVMLPLETALNHKMTTTGDTTFGIPTGMLSGKSGDIVIQVSTVSVVAWNTVWKFLNELPKVGEKASETWVVSYKVVDANTILASGVKLV